MMERRQILVLLAAAGARVLGAPAAAQAQLSADQVLTDMKLSPADGQKVLAGEFVTADVKSVCSATRRRPRRRCRRPSTG